MRRWLAFSTLTRQRAADFLQKVVARRIGHDTVFLGPTGEHW